MVREGDEVRVKCLGRDLRGLVRLSRKALLPQPDTAKPQPPQQQPRQSPYKQARTEK